MATPTPHPHTPVVFYVASGELQLPEAKHGLHEPKGLSIGPPVDIRLLVPDVGVERQDEDNGDEGRPPTDDEHDDQAQDGRKQGHPLVVELEGRTPSWGRGGNKGVCAH